MSNRNLDGGGLGFPIPCDVLRYRRVVEDLGAGGWKGRGRPRSEDTEPPVKVPRRV